MNKVELKSRKVLRKIFGCLSLTAVAFTFHACYGIPMDYYYVRFTGTVESKSTTKPIEGIKVAIGPPYHFDNPNSNIGITDKDGKFDLYAHVPIHEYYDSENDKYYPADSIIVRFSDIDSTENGYFENKVMLVNPDHKDEVKINIKLEEKE